jgi:hypothetical protein
MNIEFFCPQKMCNTPLLFGSTLMEHSRHFGCQNQALKMRMHVCYLDCHQAALCCYLVIRGTHRNPGMSITAF